MEEAYCNVWDGKKKDSIKSIIEDSMNRKIENKAIYITKQLKNIYPETRWNVICIFTNNYRGHDLNVHGPLLICYIKNECIIIYPRKGIHNPQDDAKESKDNQKFEEAKKLLSNKKIDFIDKLNDAEIKIKKYESIIKEQKSKLEKLVIEKELLHKTIKEKEDEIINLKNEIQQKKDHHPFIKTFYTREQMIALNFISTDSRLHYAIPCLNKDLFVDVEKKLYDKFPEYKEKNNNFLSHGNIVLRFKTVGENQLESGIPIIMQVS